MSLTIYKSSAGAGKTFTLAGNYIDLLFASEQRNAHRHILAVTFTKKATAEMKNRIIKELSLLAQGSQSDHAERLKKKFHLDDSRLQSRAQTILTDLLQDYGWFMVTTIDSFFQQIIRSFARELNLPGAYNLELDSNHILQNAVDDYFFNLPLDLNDPGIRALMSVVTENIENSGKWNPKETILKLSEQIFNEIYQTNRKQLQTALGEDNALTDYKKRIDSLYYSFRQELQKLEEAAEQIVESSGIDKKQLKGALAPFYWDESKFVGSISEGITANMQRLIDNTLSKDPVIQEVCTRIAPYAERFKRLLQSDAARSFATARAIRHYLPYLVILQDIQTYINRANAELNRLPISETNMLLYDVVSESGNSPFIYEKTGARISNYMIDEFQDTSSMQWRNFLPLIEEADSRGNSNMLVGDVKQSIYRWRNSDSGLLQSGVNKQFPKADNRQLATNYRTDKVIVEQNNRIFQALSAAIQAEYQSVSNDTDSLIGDIYKDVVQLPNKQEEGYMRIEFVDIKKKEDFRREIAEQLPALISDIEQRGIHKGDIAILIRNNKDAAVIADTLLANGIQVMSNEGLYLSNCTAVQLIINMLRLSITPEDKILQLHIKYEYALCKGMTQTEALNAAITDTVSIPSVDTASTLPDNVVSIINSLGLDSDTSALPYLQALRDLVYQYESKYPTDIYSFLSWWEQSGTKAALSMKSDTETVQIVTIHKSKGLEYDAVIIPFCDWETAEHQGGSDIMWVQPREENFSGIPVVPVKYERSLVNTIFKDDYLRELQSLYIDNLNLTYVAFTRPKRELYVFAAMKSYRTKNMGAALYQMMTTAKDAEGQPLFRLNDNVYECGTKVTGGSAQSTPAYNTIKFTSLTGRSKAQLNIKLPSRDYFMQNTEDRLTTSVNIGLMMHELLCKVVRRGDEKTVVAQMVSEGRLTEEEKRKVDTEIVMFQQLTASTDWFDDKWKVLNEHDILLKDGNLRRPDRVMICGNEAVVVDWKFGRKKRDEYNAQVGEYMHLIEQMGYKVKGWLCYVNLKEIEQVNI